MLQILFIIESSDFDSNSPPSLFVPTPSLNVNFQLVQKKKCQFPTVVVSLSHSELSFSKLTELLMMGRISKSNTTFDTI